MNPSLKQRCSLLRSVNLVKNRSIHNRIFLALAKFACKGTTFFWHTQEKSQKFRSKHTFQNTPHTFLQLFRAVFEEFSIQSRDFYRVFTGFLRGFTETFTGRFRINPRPFPSQSRTNHEAISSSRSITRSLSFYRMAKWQTSSSRPYFTASCALPQLCHFVTLPCHFCLFLDILRSRYYGLFKNFEWHSGTLRKCRNLY
jgi:hypothetical protein